MRAPKSRLLHRFVRDESAAASIEYAVIAAGIAGAVVAAVTTIGGNTLNMWTTIKNIFN